MINSQKSPIFTCSLAAIYKPLWTFSPFFFHVYDRIWWEYFARKLLAAPTLPSSIFFWRVFDRILGIFWEYRALAPSWCLHIQINIGLFCKNIGLFGRVLGLLDRIVGALLGVCSDVLP